MLRTYTVFNLPMFPCESTTAEKVAGHGEQTRKVFFATFGPSADAKLVQTACVCPLNHLNPASACPLL